jgi:hypothetical protein
MYDPQQVPQRQAATPPVTYLGTLIHQVYSHHSFYSWSLYWPVEATKLIRRVLSLASSASHHIIYILCQQIR